MESVPKRMKIKLLIWKIYLREGFVFVNKLKQCGDGAYMVYHVNISDKLSTQKNFDNFEEMGKMLVNKLEMTWTYFKYKKRPVFHVFAALM